MDDKLINKAFKALEAALNDENLKTRVDAATTFVQSFYKPQAKKPCPHCEGTGEITGKGPS